MGESYRKGRRPEASGTDSEFKEAGRMPLVPHDEPAIQGRKLIAKTPAGGQRYKNGVETKAKRLSGALRLRQRRCGIELWS